MARILAALLGLAVFLGARSARAAETYCVGGYEGLPRNVYAACALPSVRLLHRKWHEHCWVTDGKECFICYDEEDDTCSTTFLKNTPSFRRIDYPACARLTGEQHTANRLVAHVIEGRPVTPPPPPPPPVPLEVRLERVSPGPYTAGDRVTVVGGVREGSGGLRRIAGGVFRVTDADGHTTETPGSVEPDGTVTARVPLPASASARIEFVPTPPPLAPGESLHTAASEPQALTVEVCGLRARVVQPTAHEALVSGQATPLRVRLFDAAGQLPVATPPAGLALEFTVQVEDEDPITIAADRELSAAWTPPASPSPREARLSAGGRAGDRVVCPAEELPVTVSDLGLGFDTSKLPGTCYIGWPCEGTVRLLRPEPGASRQRVDTLLADPKVVVFQEDTGTERYRGPPRADDQYTFSATYSQPGGASWSLVLQTPRGPVAMPVHELHIRPPLELHLPAQMDFGTVAAGTPREKVCQRLDFSQTPGAEEHRWGLSVEGLAGCQARPMLQFVARGRTDARSLVAERVEVEALDPRARWLDICLEVPRCAGEVAPETAVLRVVPLTPEFESQQKTVRLRWTVEGRSWLGCHGVWVWPCLALLGLGVVLVGFTRPARFPPGASIRVAGSERGIRQAAAVLLRACPGSGPGFYRDARLGLQGDGEVKGALRNALVHLRADRGAGVLLAGPGPLEQQDRRTLKWEPVAELARGHVPSSSALYRAGDTYFKVEL